MVATSIVGAGAPPACRLERGLDLPQHADIFELRAGLVRNLHGRVHPGVLYLTGGGIAAITDLLVAPGASQTVLDLQVPYGHRALVALLRDDAHGSPRAAVSEETAVRLAERALDRSAELAPDRSHRIGLACTAALATTAPKRGDHRAHLALATPTGVHRWKVTLDKGVRSRAAEDRVISDVVLGILAWTIEIPLPPPAAGFLDLGPRDEIEGPRLEGPPLRHGPPTPVPAERSVET